MVEDVLKDVELESQPRGFLFNFKLLKDRMDPVLIIFTIVASTLILFTAYKFQIFSLWSEFLQSSLLLKLSTYPFLVSAILVISGMLFRTYLWFRYKPFVVEQGENINWPFLSVIVPAFNEEDLISKSLDSVFSANYPENRLDVICVNDGSTDLTLFYMNKAKQKFGDRLKVISFRNNLGKRKALYAGVKNARGEIIITVDSDSRIGRNALRNVVLPLIKDERTGAVAGRVAALNEKDNFLTRMLNIRYSVSFDFGRAYQSVYGGVFCCPGALTAYRKSVLMSFIREWLHQKFLDTPCTYGEDRALTTNILKRGYLTRYQSNAVVYTHVPQTIRSMNKMYLRWTRSYIRESILFAKFMFTRYRVGNRLLPALDFFFLNFLHPFHILSIFIITYSFIVNPLFILRHFAFLVITSFFLSLYYLRTNKSLTFLYGIPYALITALLLWWIVPYSALTMKNQSWLTK